MKADAWAKGNIMEASTMAQQARALTDLCNQLSKVDYMASAFSKNEFESLTKSIRDILCTVYAIQNVGYTAKQRLNKAIASLKGALDIVNQELNQNVRAQLKQRSLSLVSDCLFITGYLTTQSTYTMETATECIAIPSIPNAYSLPTTSTITENKVVPLSEGMSDAATYYAYGTKDRKNTAVTKTQEIRKGLSSNELSKKLIGAKSDTKPPVSTHIIKENKDNNNIKEQEKYASEAEEAIGRQFETLAAHLITDGLNTTSNALGLSSYGISLSSLLSGTADPNKVIGSVAQNVLGGLVGDALGNLIPNTIGGPVGSVIGQLTGVAQSAIGSLIGEVFKPGNPVVPDLIADSNPAIAAVGERVSMVDGLMPEGSLVPTAKTGWDAINPTESSWDAINPSLPSNQWDASGGYPGQEGFGANNESWEKWCENNYEDIHDDIYLSEQERIDKEIAGAGGIQANDGRLGDGTRPGSKDGVETVKDNKFADDAKSVTEEDALTSEKAPLNPEAEDPSGGGSGGSGGNSDDTSGSRSLTLPEEQKRRAYAHPKLTFEGGELVLQVRQKQVTEGVVPQVKRTFGARLVFIEEKSPISVNMSGFLFDYEGMDNVDKFLESLRKASIVEYDEYFQAKVPKGVTLKIEGNEYKGILTGFSYGKSSDNPYMYQTTIQFIGYQLGERDTPSGGTTPKDPGMSSKMPVITNPTSPDELKDKVKQQADSAAIKALRDRVSSVEKGIPQLSRSYIEQSVSYDYAYDGSSTLIPIQPNDRPVSQSTAFNSVSSSFAQEVQQRVSQGSDIFNARLQNARTSSKPPKASSIP